MMACKRCCVRSSTWFWLTLWTFLLVGHRQDFLLAAAAKEEEMECQADGTCATNTEQQQQQEILIVNQSPYRADIHYDDGGFGEFMYTVDARGGRTILGTLVGDSFFVTRHGVKEGLFDVSKDVQHGFTVQAGQKTFVIPKDAAPSPNKCQDRFSVCPFYAEHGSCWDTPGWMIVHCCKSCDKYMEASKLIDPKIRCSKENLNITEPAWKPGDLNDLFTSWATDPKFLPFQPTVLSSPDGAHGGKSGPWVMTFDNFVTDKEAAALIKGGEMVGFHRSTDQGEVNEMGEMEKVVSQSRTSSNAWCVGECEKLPEVHSVTQRIEDVTGIPRKNYESFQILEYTGDQFYRMHHDTSEGIEDDPAGHRILTFFLYLTDVEEGGETAFNKLDLAVKPKRGRALVWPSVLNDQPNMWDERMYHEARDVIKGTKYAANHWIHMNDYEGPNIWGCTGSFD